MDYKDLRHQVRTRVNGRSFFGTEAEEDGCIEFIYSMVAKYMRKEEIVIEDLRRMNGIISNYGNKWEIDGNFISMMIEILKNSDEFIDAGLDILDSVYYFSDRKNPLLSDEEMIDSLYEIVISGKKGQRIIAIQILANYCMYDPEVSIRIATKEMINCIISFISNYSVYDLCDRSLKLMISMSSMPNHLILEQVFPYLLALLSDSVPKISELAFNCVFQYQMSILKTIDHNHVINSMIKSLKLGFSQSNLLLFRCLSEISPSMSLTTYINESLISDIDYVLNQSGNKDSSPVFKFLSNSMYDSWRVFYESGLIGSIIERFDTVSFLNKYHSTQTICSFFYVAEEEAKLYAAKNGVDMILFILKSDYSEGKHYLVSSFNEMIRLYCDIAYNDLEEILDELLSDDDEIIRALADQIKNFVIK